MSSFCKMLRSFVFGFLLCIAIPCLAHATPWWSSKKVEIEKTIDQGLFYQQVEYQTVMNKPVRAHILSVTGVGSKYLIGVIGSYGTLFQASEFSRRSEALALINGGFYTIAPTRATGLVMVHGRILYPPASTSKSGTVGFSPTKTLFDWLGLEDVDESRMGLTKEGWEDCYAALSAGPLLLKDNVIQVNHEKETFNVGQRAPRTAIGKRSDEMVYFVVVDGRQPDWSAGVTLNELAELFVDLKCSEALNLDGGGSSTMVIQDKVINKPSDDAMPDILGREREIANVVTIFQKK